MNAAAPFTKDRQDYHLQVMEASGLCMSRGSSHTSGCTIRRGVVSERKNSVRKAAYERTLHVTVAVRS